MTTSVLLVMHISQDGKEWFIFGDLGYFGLLSHLHQIRNHNGCKISRIAKKSSEEICAEVKAIADSSLETSNQINSLVIAMVNLDQGSFEKIIAT